MVSIPIWLQAQDVSSSSGYHLYIRAHPKATCSIESSLIIRRVGTHLRSQISVVYTWQPCSSSSLMWQHPNLHLLLLDAGMVASILVNSPQAFVVRMAFLFDRGGVGVHKDLTVFPVTQLVNDRVRPRTLSLDPQAFIIPNPHMQSSLGPHYWRARGWQGNSRVVQVCVLSTACVGNCMSSWNQRHWPLKQSEMGLCNSEGWCLMGGAVSLLCVVPNFYSSQLPLQQAV